MNPFDDLFFAGTEHVALRPPADGLPEALTPFLRQGRVTQPIQRRLNCLSGEWTHFNLARTARPIITRPAKDEAAASGCVFCPGQESRTPVEADGRDLRGADTPWTWRAFPNLYPWLLDHRNIVQTPVHRLPLAQADGEEEARGLLATAQLGGEAEAQGWWPVVFRNHGGATSQPHPHWQCGALPRWPTRDAQQYERAAAFYHQHGQHLFDVLWTQEEARRERFVGSFGPWAVFCPFAPRFEFETWIVCTVQRASLSACMELELRLLGHLLAATLRALATTCNVDDVLIVVHQLVGESCYRLYVEVCPGTIWAGAERGFGEWVVERPPELTAERLRPSLLAEREAILAAADGD